MQKYVKIVFRDKTHIHLPIQKWESIVKDQANLAAYKLEGQSEWLGHTLNKVDVMYSEYDQEYSEEVGKPEFDYYKDTKRDVVIKIQAGTLPDDLERFQKIG